METRVFNPTATTQITNVTLNINISDEFSLSGGSTLDITVVKCYLDNDTQVDNETFTIAPSLSNNVYSIGLSKIDTTVLDSLEPMQYYKILYTIITPSIVGNYQFEPVTVEYDASTWILPQ